MSSSASAIPSAFLADLVSPRMIGMPLMKKFTSVRMSGGVPLENVSSSVTWYSVGFQVVEVDQPDVPFPPLGLDEHGLQPLEELPGVQVAFDARPDPDQPVPDRLGPQMVHHAGVQPLKLIDQHAVQHRAGQAAPQVAVPVRASGTSSRLPGRSAGRGSGPSRVHCRWSWELGSLWVELRSNYIISRTQQIVANACSKAIRYMRAFVDSQHLCNFFTTYLGQSLDAYPNS